MVSAMNRDVKLLTLGFALIFFGFGGVQQYVTTFFTDNGSANFGFYSLILVYLFFTLFDPLSAVLVSKYGAKNCMIASSVFYSVYIVSLLSESAFIIYLSSSLLGIAAALLWTGQNSYLIRVSDRKSYGTNSGYFNSLETLGAALGIFIIGFVISKASYSLSFLIFSALPVFGFLALLFLKDVRAEQKTSHFALIRKAITSTTALRLSGIWFAANFVFGLVIGIFPVEIKNAIGAQYVGILSSLSYIIPVALSYYFGKLSDAKGRTAMILLSYALLAAGVASLYFSPHPAFLISGIILLALSRAIVAPIAFALSGDVSTGRNLEYLVALFWMVQNISIVIALVLSQIFLSDATKLYAISAIVLIVSFIISYPVIMQAAKSTRKKIALEMK